MNTDVSPAPPSPRLLSDQLDDLRIRMAGGGVTLGGIIAALEGRAYTLLLILFALPFVAPVSVPGSSTPLGLIVAIVAAQLAVGRLPWLPGWILRWELPPGFLNRVVPVTARVVRKLERVLHPRWPQWTATGTRRALHLLTIVAAGLLLALPILIPFTNMLPGWAILLLACGLLERDGVVLAAGHAVFLATLVYFALLASGIAEALLHAIHWLAR